MLKVNLLFFGYSADNLSISRLVNPDPVPPPNEWKIRKPCKPLHRSVNLRIRSNARSTISFPENRGASDVDTEERLEINYAWINDYLSCNDHGRNYLRRLLSQLSAALDGTAACTCPYGLRLKIPSTA